jgi:GNAT superfamily N-acetyltransferase
MIVNSPSEAVRDGFLISTDPERLDLDAIERLLRSAYWAPTRSRESIERGVQNSLCFGLYETQSGRQIGLTRVVTDFATFPWLCDVIVEEEHRGNGLGRWMMETVFSNPDVRDVSRWILATRDAFALYEPLGFVPLAHPGRWMERRV